MKPPLAKAVETLIETGDFHVTTVGDNLPNENEIHEKYGSKSFLFTGQFARARARHRIRSARGIRGFARRDRARQEIRRRSRQTLMTALHEIIGHGSGKLNPKLTHEPAYLSEGIFLDARGSPRRSDGAVERLGSESCASSGLNSNPDVAKAMYYDAVRVALTQLRRIPKGDTIEEDHERDRQLIVNYIRDKTGAIAEVKRDGKTYLAIRDFEKMRQGVGQLLAELMRIKAEGDYDAIKALIDKYGVHFDPALRDQVVERYREAEPAHLLGRHQSRVDRELRRAGKISKVEISYPRDFVKQQLGYSAMYPQKK